MSHRLSFTGTFDAALTRITVEKEAALRENRVLRVENESLKDRLEESGRKLEEVCKGEFDKQLVRCWMLLRNEKCTSFLSLLVIGAMAEGSPADGLPTHGEESLRSRRGRQFPTD